MRKLAFILIMLASVGYVAPTYGQGDDDSAITAPAEPAGPSALVNPDDVQGSVNAIVGMAKAWKNAPSGPPKVATAVLFFGTLAFLILQLLKRWVPGFDEKTPVALKRVLASVFAAVPALVAAIKAGQPWWSVILTAVLAAATPLLAHIATKQR